MDRAVSAVDSLYQSPVQSTLLLCALVLLFLKLASSFSSRRSNPLCLPLPPGPKGYPLIGHVLDMPTSQQWRTYAQWAKVYGDVFSFDVLGQRIIVLNSLEAAQELFEKRSANYSGRPRMPMLLELMDFGYLLGLLPYGPWWRRHRRAFDEHFRASVVWKYQAIQTCETRTFLNRLLQSPGDFILHIQEAIASSIMVISYGIKISGVNDPYIVNIQEAVHGLSIAATPGAFLVDLIPALKYVPSWFPGAGFKKKAAYWAKVKQKVVELPFNHVEQQIKEGTAGASLAASLIEALRKGDDKLLSEELIIARNVAAAAFAAGADTTTSTIQSFFLAMAKYPDAQKKAQAELDKVVGHQRLPEFSDRLALPFVNAIIKETLRWQLVAPLAIPHVAADDDVYGGFFIPKGSIVLGNAWAVLHDEAIFPDPEEFQPERYLKDGQLDFSVRQPEVGVYGFGRRICPGRYLSDNMLFSIVSSTLHAFNMSPSLDETGVPVPLSAEMTSGILSYPVPFKVDIEPRNISAETLVKDAATGDF